MNLVKAIVIMSLYCLSRITLRASGFFVELSLSLIAVALRIRMESEALL